MYRIKLAYKLNETIELNWNVSFLKGGKACATDYRSQQTQLTYYASELGIESQLYLCKLKLMFLSPLFC